MTEKRQPQKRILVAEDDPAICRRIVRLLKNRGLLVLTAKDGGEALRMAELLLPDLLIINDRLPKINGTEVCSRLNINKQTRAIRTIFIHEEESAVKIRKKTKAGKFNGVVRKPFDDLEIINVAVTLLANT